MAIRDFKGTASLTGPAKDAYEDARTQANSANPPETLMIANLTDFAIMRSADNLAREAIMQKAMAKVDHDGVRPNAYLTLKRMRQDPELSVALDSINERESGCSGGTRKSSSPPDSDPAARDMLEQLELPYENWRTRCSSRDSESSGGCFASSEITDDL